MDAAGGALGQHGASTPAPTGELIVQNGRLKGARRPLGSPLTFLGKSAVCDVRLNVDGISPLHCLIVHANGEVHLRDLESEGGTYLNGERVACCQLRDGDLLAVGPFLFKLRLPQRPEQLGGSGDSGTVAGYSGADRAALRIQVAAVVAQQAALTEQEAKLDQRREMLEKQEAQLAAHLEDKRRRLLELHNQVQAARQNLQRDRQTYEDHVGRVTGDLSVAERELLQKQQEVEAERKRLRELRTKLKHRYHRHWLGEREQMQRREQELAEAIHQLDGEQQRLDAERQALAQACRKFNAELEVGRRQLQEEWDRVQQEEKALKKRQQNLKADQRQMQTDLERRESELEHGQAVLQEEAEQWQKVVADLQIEAEGLENRIRNQRRKVFDQQQEIQHLETVLREFQQRVATAEPSATPAASSEPSPEDMALDGLTSDAEKATEPRHVPAPDQALVPVSQPTMPTTVDAEYQVILPPSKAEQSLYQRLTDLEQLAGDLSDQRRQLAEQWQRMAQTQQAWQQMRDITAAEMTELTTRMHQQAQVLLGREQELDRGIDELRQRQEELTQVRQQLVAWQARLKAREVAWESERDRLLGELRNREEVVERQVHSLQELRQRWSRRRRQEADLLRAERQACEKARQEFLNLGEERRGRLNALEDERRLLTGKALAVEQYRQECLTRSSDAASAERRIDRLRRRWFNEQAEVLRAAQREKEELRSELQRLQERFVLLHRRIDESDEERVALAERQTEWEQKVIEGDCERAQLRQEVLSLQQQRAQSEQQVLELHNEIERIARHLLDEPEAPTILRAPFPATEGPMGKAA